MKSSFLSIVLSFLLITGCSSNDKNCSPGKVEHCPCPGQDDGIQTCLPDGSGWTECDCPCQPDCDGRECGDDGCGSTCPPGCDLGYDCDNSGQCQRIWECTSNADCEPGYYCDLTVHECKEEICEPQCDGMCCGSDGCDGACPDICTTGFKCNIITCTCEPSIFSLSFDWNFGPDQKNCIEAQVTNVRVEILQNDISLSVATLPCDSGGAVIEDLEIGTYTLELTGLNASYQNYYTASLEVDILDQDVDLGVVTLDPIGFMVFGWVFGLSEWDCITAGVDRVRVKLYDELASELLFEASPIPQCEDQGIILEDWHLGSYNLVLEGVCESDLTTGYALDAIIEVLHPGENDYGELLLEDVGGCP